MRHNHGEMLGLMEMIKSDMSEQEQADTYINRAEEILKAHQKDIDNDVNFCALLTCLFLVTFLISVLWR